MQIKALLYDKEWKRLLMRGLEIGLLVLATSTYFQGQLQAVFGTAIAAVILKGIRDYLDKK